MGALLGKIEVRGALESNLMCYRGRPMVSRVSSLGLSPLRARERIYAWSGRASGRIQLTHEGANYWMAGVLCGPGAGLGADRLKPAFTIQS